MPEFLIKLLKEQYGKEITDRIIKGYSVHRNVTLRINTLKTDVRAIQMELDKLGIQYETVPWSKEALVLKNAQEKDMQALEMYRKGEIYLQSLSSMLPPIILNPKPNMDILDMTAAPGGKTTQIAAMTKNSAHITACEMNRVRAERLKYNIEKQGATSVYVMLTDSRKIDDFFSFDRILLDAPCSGSGTLYRQDSMLERRFTMPLIEKSIKLQVALLKKAITILKSGQKMVYSTCSILDLENEHILNQVLKNKKVEIVPIEFEGMESLPLLPTRMDGTLCICPDELYEGFFVAKMIKRG